MSTYIAFLRAINLGATRRLPMTQVKAALGQVGFGGVETYLATGNVKVEVEVGCSSARVRTGIANALSLSAGFDVPVVLISETELLEVHAEAHSLDDGAAGKAEKRQVAFLPEPLTPQARDELSTWSVRHASEGAYAGSRHLHWWTDGAVSDAVLFTPATLRHLGIAGATSRTLRVVDTVVERWC